MASLTSLISSPPSSTNNIFPKTSQLSAPIGRLQTLRKSQLAVTCKSSNGRSDPFDEVLAAAAAASRRDVLLGLGAGLYGAGAFVTDPFSAAFARPIDGPSQDVCKLATPSPGNPLQIECCPPAMAGRESKPFQFPSPSEPKRIRRPAHLASQDKEYVEKYKLAMKRMKCLPPEDPRSFFQQAKVHCAYCNGSYVQSSHTNLGLQIHFSWLFLPFHRMYLHFYERILGSLIQDPTFALPFWNWDHEDGMAIAEMFKDPESPLFDGLRNVYHLPSNKPLDLRWDRVTEDKPFERIRDDNYARVYELMVSGAQRRLEFFGPKYRAGDPPPAGGGGTSERLHNMAHLWTGGHNQQFGEDMGNFYSAGRDPIFYVHHCNVDRLWNVWKTIGGFRFDFDDYDYLNTSFLFYDENSDLIKIKVKDVLDPQALGLEYEDRPIPWRNSRPVPTAANAARTATAAAFGGPAEAQAAITSPSAFPLVLEKVTTVMVPRPKKGRTAKEKSAASEILVVEGIELEGDKVVQFEVVINDDPDNPSGPSNSEFAGSFLNIPHVHGNNGHNKFVTGLRMDITELLEDIGAENDDQIQVTLVPKKSDGPVTIGGLKIEYSS
ncbi:unnamed protein product [Linum tenue]|uniref:Tyrosinase copper-binding domain-containing protein n=1 Tax=Linum tenue TaxID=586396 RepID=A0AAV0KID9_9ROSI|nr:unnamed protein product [Linum tenue]